MRIVYLWLLGAVVSMITLMMAVSASIAEDIDALKGKTIRSVIGEAAGETTDVQARLFLKYLQKALPDTTILIQNKAGGGGAKALKELSDASGDILTIATLSRNPIYAQLMKPDDSTYDISKMIWVGALAKINRILAVRSNMGGTTVDYLENLDRQPIMGATQNLGSAAIEPLMLNAMTKLRFKVITGMNEADRQVMLLAGNIDGRMGSLYELQPLFDAKTMVPVLKFTRDGYPKSLDNVPTLAEVVESDDSKDIVSVLETLDRVGGLMVAAAPNSDPQLLQGLRVAFDRVTADSEFRTEAAKIYFDINPTSGEALAEALSRIVGPKRDMGGEMRAALSCGLKKSDEGALKCN